ncbi:aldehyde dehydrogenase 1A1 [Phlebotomus papatasi]|uniref:aldehyde dehydrogenase 1A1 n=1 Tax=Phlebotomus papatasi TaxID=29031 RepID=UPI0024837A6D|nr:aldehyde dehydrogenase 1A1 [Phlebotomus papatasi]
MANPNQQVVYTKLFINNEFVDSKSGKTFPTVNPANCKKIAEISEADKEDVDVAVAAAKKAFARGSEWRNLDASARGRLLNKLADLVARDIDTLANLESLDNGKPFGDSVFDINCAIDTFRYYAGWADKIHGNTIPADGTSLTLTRKEPVGVVGQIIPWNYPILMLAWKWGPAIAAGCTIVLKPAEATPLTALYCAALTKEAGFPAGVINVLPGYGPTAGYAIATHPDIHKVAFTGSVDVGKIIMEAAAKSNLKKVSLELGGKSPLVIFDDANLDEAVEIAHNAIFANHGQNCCAGSRTFVQEGIYDEFIKRSIELVKKRKLGDAFEKDVVQGPQVDEKIFNRILKYVEAGKKEGAKLEFGGKRWGNEGYFIEPTIFSGVTDGMIIAREEIFGPVMSVFKFKTLDEVIERSNNTNYGLASGVITSNINNALVFAQAVQAGSVWVNCYDAVVPQAPFGGFKQSGAARELGEDGLGPYLETKTISIKLPTNN